MKYPDPVADADAYMDRKEREIIKREESIKQTAYWLMKDFANPTEYINKRGYKAMHAESTISEWISDPEAELGKIAQIVAANIGNEAEIGKLVHDHIVDMVKRIATDMEDYND